MEQNPNIDYLKQYTNIGLEFLIQLSNIEDDELVKICLDFWHFFTMDILKKTRAQIFDQNNRQDSMTKTGMNLNYGQFQNGILNSFMHTQIYPAIMEELRETIIDIMAKPREVLVVIDEYGEAVEE